MVNGIFVNGNSRDALTAYTNLDAPAFHEERPMT